MNSEVYYALKKVGKSAEMGKAAAQALVNYEARFASIDTDLVLLKWMVGFNLAFTMAVLWKL